MVTTASMATAVRQAAHPIAESAATYEALLRRTGDARFVRHLDRTHAVEPLERTAGWDAGEAPATFPYGV